MLEKLVANILATYLDRYIDGLKESNLRVSLWHGKIELENLHLRHSALLGLELPITIKEGYVGNLSITIPWSRLRSEPVQISLRNISIIIIPKVAGNYNEKDDLEHQWRRKKDALEIWELAQGHLLGFDSVEQKLRGQSVSSSIGSGGDTGSKDKTKDQGFIEALKSTILNNIHLKFENVSIIYEDNFTNPRETAILSIHFETLSASTSDSNGANQHLRDTGTALLKIIQINCLTVNIIFMDTGRGGINNGSQCTKQSTTESITLSVRNSVQEYILAPLSITLYAKRKLNLAQLDVPRWKLSTDISCANFTINGRQINFLAQTVNFFENYNSYKECMQFRPGDPKQTPLVDPRAWWQFAINATLMVVRRNRGKDSQVDAAARRSMQSEYIELYKKSKIRKDAATPLTVQDSQRIIEIERALPLEILKASRALSWTKLRAEVRQSADYNRGSISGLPGSGSAVVAQHEGMGLWSRLMGRRSADTAESVEKLSESENAAEAVGETRTDTALTLEEEEQLHAFLLTQKWTTQQRKMLAKEFGFDWNESEETSVLLQSSYSPADKQSSMDNTGNCTKFNFVAPPSLHAEYLWIEISVIIGHAEIRILNHTPSNNCLCGLQITGIEVGYKDTEDTFALLATFESVNLHASPETGDEVTILSTGPRPCASEEHVANDKCKTFMIKFSRLEPKLNDGLQLRLEASISSLHVLAHPSWIRQLLAFAVFRKALSDVLPKLGEKQHSMGNILPFAQLLMKVECEQLFDSRITFQNLIITTAGDDYKLGSCDFVFSELVVCNDWEKSKQRRARVLKARDQMHHTVDGNATKIADANTFLLSDYPVYPPGVSEDDYCIFFTILAEEFKINTTVNDCTKEGSSELLLSGIPIEAEIKKRIIPPLEDNQNEWSFAFRVDDPVLLSASYERWAIKVESLIRLFNVHDLCSESDSKKYKIARIIGPVPLYMHSSDCFSTQFAPPRICARDEADCTAILRKDGQLVIYRQGIGLPPFISTKLVKNQFSIKFEDDTKNVEEALNALPLHLRMVSNHASRTDNSLIQYGLTLYIHQGGFDHSVRTDLELTRKILEILCVPQYDMLWHQKEAIEFCAAINANGKAACDPAINQRLRKLIEQSPLLQQLAQNYNWCYYSVAYEVLRRCAHTNPCMAIGFFFTTVQARNEFYEALSMSGGNLEGIFETEKVPLNTVNQYVKAVMQFSFPEMKLGVFNEQSEEISFFELQGPASVFASLNRGELSVMICGESVEVFVGDQANEIFEGDGYLGDHKYFNGIVCAPVLRTVLDPGVNRPESFRDIVSVTIKKNFRKKQSAFLVDANINADTFFLVNDKAVICAELFWDLAGIFTGREFMLNEIFSCSFSSEFCNEMEQIEHCTILLQQDTVQNSISALLNRDKKNQLSLKNTTPYYPKSFFPICNLSFTIYGDISISMFHCSDSSISSSEGTQLKPFIQIKAEGAAGSFFFCETLNETKVQMKNPTVFMNRDNGKAEENKSFAAYRQLLGPKSRTIGDSTGDRCHKTTSPGVLFCEFGSLSKPPFLSLHEWSILSKPGGNLSGIKQFVFIEKTDSGEFSFHPQIIANISSLNCSGYFFTTFVTASVINSAGIFLQSDLSSVLEYLKCGYPSRLIALATRPPFSISRQINKTRFCDPCQFVNSSKPVVKKSKILRECSRDKTLRVDHCYQFNTLQFAFELREVDLVVPSSLNIPASILARVNNVLIFSEFNIHFFDAISMVNSPAIRHYPSTKAVSHTLRVKIRGISLWVSKEPSLTYLPDQMSTQSSYNTVSNCNVFCGCGSSMVESASARIWGVPEDFSPFLLELFCDLNKPCDKHAISSFYEQADKCQGRVTEIVSCSSVQFVSYSSIFDPHQLIPEISSTVQLLGPFFTSLSSLQLAAVFDSLFFCFMTSAVSRYKVFPEPDRQFTLRNAWVEIHCTQSIQTEYASVCVQRRGGNMFLVKKEFGFEFPAAVQLRLRDPEMKILADEIMLKPESDILFYFSGPSVARLQFFVNGEYKFGLSGTELTVYDTYKNKPALLCPLSSDRKFLSLRGGTTHLMPFCTWGYLGMQEPFAGRHVTLSASSFGISAQMNSSTLTTVVFARVIDFSLTPLFLRDVRDTVGSLLCINSFLRLLNKPVLSIYTKITVQAPSSQLSYKMQADIEEITLSLPSQPWKRISPKLLFLTFLGLSIKLSITDNAKYFLSFVLKTIGENGVIIGAGNDENAFTLITVQTEEDGFVQTSVEPLISAVLSSEGESIIEVGCFWFFSPVKEVFSLISNAVKCNEMVQCVKLAVPLEHRWTNPYVSDRISAKLCDKHFWRKLRLIIRNLCVIVLEDESLRNSHREKRGMLVNFGYFSYTHWRADDGLQHHILAVASSSISALHGQKHYYLHPLNFSCSVDELVNCGVNVSARMEGVRINFGLQEYEIILKSIARHASSITFAHESMESSTISVITTLKAEGEAEREQAKDFKTINLRKSFPGTKANLAARELKINVYWDSLLILAGNSESALRVAMGRINFSSLFTSHSTIPQCKLGSEMVEYIPDPSGSNIPCLSGGVRSLRIPSAYRHASAVSFSYNTRGRDVPNLDDLFPSQQQDMGNSANEDFAKDNSRGIISTPLNELNVNVSLHGFECGLEGQEPLFCLGRIASDTGDMSSEATTVQLCKDDYNSLISVQLGTAELMLDIRNAKNILNFFWEPYTRILSPAISGMEHTLMCRSVISTDYYIKSTTLLGLHSIFRFSSAASNYIICDCGGNDIFFFGGSFLPVIELESNVTVVFCNGRLHLNDRELYAYSVIIKRDENIHLGNDIDECSSWVFADDSCTVISPTESRHALLKLNPPLGSMWERVALWEYGDKLVGAQLDEAQSSISSPIVALQERQFSFTVTGRMKLCLPTRDNLLVNDERLISAQATLDVEGTNRVVPVLALVKKNIDTDFRYIILNEHAESIMLHLIAIEIDCTYVKNSTKSYIMSPWSLQAYVEGGQSLRHGLKKLSDGITLRDSKLPESFSPSQSDQFLDFVALPEKITDLMNTSCTTGFLDAPKWNGTLVTNKTLEIFLHYGNLRALMEAAVMAKEVLLRKMDRELLGLSGSLVIAAASRYMLAIKKRLQQGRINGSTNFQVEIPKLTVVAINDTHHTLNEFPELQFTISKINIRSQISDVLAIAESEMIADGKYFNRYEGRWQSLMESVQFRFNISRSTQNYDEINKTFNALQAHLQCDDIRFHVTPVFVEVFARCMSLVSSSNLAKTKGGSKNNDLLVEPRLRSSYSHVLVQTLGIPVYVEFAEDAERRFPSPKVLNTSQQFEFSFPRVGGRELAPAQQCVILRLEKDSPPYILNVASVCKRTIRLQVGMAWYSFILEIAMKENVKHVILRTCVTFHNKMSFPVYLNSVGSVAPLERKNIPLHKLRQRCVLRPYDEWNRYRKISLGVRYDTLDALNGHKLLCVSESETLSSLSNRNEIYSKNVEKTHQEGERVPLGNSYSFIISIALQGSVSDNIQDVVITLNSPLLFRNATPQPIVIKLYCINAHKNSRSPNQQRYSAALQEVATFFISAGSEIPIESVNTLDDIYLSATTSFEFGEQLDSEFPPGSSPVLICCGQKHRDATRAKTIGLRNSEGAELTLGISYSGVTVTLYCSLCVYNHTTHYLRFSTTPSLGGDSRKPKLCAGLRPEGIPPLATMPFLFSTTDYVRDSDPQAITECLRLSAKTCNASTRWEWSQWSLPLDLKLDGVTQKIDFQKGNKTLPFSYSISFTSFLPVVAETNEDSDENVPLTRVLTISPRWILVSFCKYPLLVRLNEEDETTTELRPSGIFVAENVPLRSNSTSTTYNPQQQLVFAQFRHMNTVSLEQTGTQAQATEEEPALLTSTWTVPVSINTLGEYFLNVCYTTEMGESQYRTKSYVIHIVCYLAGDVYITRIQEPERSPYIIENRTPYALFAKQLGEALQFFICPRGSSVFTWDKDKNPQKLQIWAVDGFVKSSPAVVNLSPEALARGHNGSLFTEIKFEEISRRDIYRKRRKRLLVMLRCFKGTSFICITTDDIPPFLKTEILPSKMRVKMKFRSIAIAVAEKKEQSVVIVIGVKSGGISALFTQGFDDSYSDMQQQAYMQCWNLVVGDIQVLDLQKHLRTSIVVFTTMDNRKLSICAKRRLQKSGPVVIILDLKLDLWPMRCYIEDSFLTALLRMKQAFLVSLKDFYKDKTALSASAIPRCAQWKFEMVRSRVQINHLEQEWPIFIEALRIGEILVSVSLKRGDGSEDLFRQKLGFLANFVKTVKNAQFEWKPVTYNCICKKAWLIGDMIATHYKKEYERQLFGVVQKAGILVVKRFMDDFIGGYIFNLPSAVTVNRNEKIRMRSENPLLLFSEPTFEDFPHDAFTPVHEEKLKKFSQIGLLSRNALEAAGFTYSECDPATRHVHPATGVEIAFDTGGLNASTAAAVLEWDDFCSKASAAVIKRFGHIALRRVLMKRDYRERVPSSHCSRCEEIEALRLRRTQAGKTSLPLPGERTDDLVIPLSWEEFAHHIQWEEFVKLCKDDEILKYKNAVKYGIIGTTVNVLRINLIPGSAAI